jgi:hypothetical protein
MHRRAHSSGSGVPPRRSSYLKRYGGQKWSSGGHCRAYTLWVPRSTTKKKDKKQILMLSPLMHQNLLGELHFLLTPLANIQLKILAKIQCNTDRLGRYRRKNTLNEQPELEPDETDIGNGVTLNTKYGLWHRQRHEQLTGKAAPFVAATARNAFIMRNTTATQGRA